MNRCTVRWIAVAALFSAFLVSGCKKKVSEGKRCKGHKDCKKPLKCVNNRCVDITGESKECKWVTSCLKALVSSNHPEVDRDRAIKWYKKIKDVPIKQDCINLTRIGVARTQPPYVWKPLCGEPPMEGLIKPTDSGNPFRVQEFKISASRVPPDDKYFAKRTGPGHFMDQCKAWVKFEVTRKFQGRVVAVFHQEYDCQKVEVKEDGKKVKKDQCKTRRYGRTDSFYYLYWTKPGTVKSVNFYVETPPDVCKGRVEKHYPTGCYCTGLSESKITLEAEEDKFVHPEDIKLAEEYEKSMEGK